MRKSGCPPGYDLLLSVRVLHMSNADLQTDWRRMVGGLPGYNPEFGPMDDFSMDLAPCITGLIGAGACKRAGMD
jgi:hypothetical protein